jgi:hypothetical protein
MRNSNLVERARLSHKGAYIMLSPLTPRVINYICSSHIELALWLGKGQDPGSTDTPLPDGPARDISQTTYNERKERALISSIMDLLLVILLSSIGWRIE